MNDKLLEKADMLMHRRTFVAGANTDAAAPPEIDATDEDAAPEEIPVLTEVVGMEEETAGPAETSRPAQSQALAQQIENAVRERLDALLSTRQAELAQEIETWLDEQMPQLVIRAMDGITDHLVALLANRVRDELLPRLEAALRPPREEAADSGHGD